LFSLSYPAMTSDPAPLVVGAAAEGDEPAPSAVRLRRADGWVSGAAPLNGQGVFTASVELTRHEASHFDLVGIDGEGREVAVEPSRITIVHGVTVGSPTLSRTVGVATANDEVRVFFPRGTALPARKTWTFSTVEGLSKGAEESLLAVPIVQGESTQAHLCRVVGKIDIRGSALKASLPIGSAMEVSLSLDRSGALSGFAVVPFLGQRFDQVARLLLPDADVASLRAQIEPLRERLQAATTAAEAEHFEALLRAKFLLSRASTDVESALGGDADAAQKARRTLLEIDEITERAQAAVQWKELEVTALDMHGRAALLVEQFGTDAERKMLPHLLDSLHRAREARQLALFETHLKVLEQITEAAFQRRPDAPELMFAYLENQVERSLDPARARSLVVLGREALAGRDRSRLRSIVDEMWHLHPCYEQDRKRGHDSGVR
jgi:molecular chaperone DnaK